jgi:ribosomal protein S18 acetylase RimI-like enzyme
MKAIPVTHDLIRAVADAVARGFQDNEIWSWVIPDDRRRARLLPRVYRARIRHLYLPRGVAYTTPDAVGGALWIPPGQPKRTLRDSTAEALALFPGIGIAGARRGSRMDELMDSHKPGEPHWYLEVLSIDPDHQRKGHGTTLITPALERADADGVPAYLETNRESNLPYYRRFGFELTEKVSLPDSPPLWMMLREPRPPT